MSDDKHTPLRLQLQK